MALSNVSGFPRIGRNRELKFATEGYWRGETSADELAATAKAIRVENWKLMQDAGIDLIPSNDFSYYDQVLDTIALVGAVPERYGWDGGQVDLDTYFAMARGRQTDGQDVTAMEMTKWFDTNYHYIVPELGPDTRFSLSSSKPFDEHAEAMEELGIDTVPVLIGPVSFLLLSKLAEARRATSTPLDLIEPLVEVYGEVIERLAEQGATWVQFDEPCFVEDRSEKELDALRLAYEELCKVHERPRILVKTYFDHVGDAYGVLRDLPIEGVGLDFTGNVHGDRLAPDVHVHGGRHNAEFIANQEGLDDQWLFAGIVDGRNVWINHLEHSLDALDGLQTPDRAARRLDQLLAAPRPDRPRCRARGRGRGPRRRDALLDGVRGAEGRRGRDPGEGAGRGPRGDRRRAGRQRPRARLPARLAPDQQPRGPRADRRLDRGARPARRARSRQRRQAQRARIDLPELFPTTTIGSFPQTDEIRADPREADARARSTGRPTRSAMQGEIEQGDPLPGGRRASTCSSTASRSATTWSSTSASRWRATSSPRTPGCSPTARATCGRRSSSATCCRPSPMTVDWITYAQSLTDEAGQGHAHRPGDDARVVVRPRRPAARGDLQAARAGDPRRGRGPREGRASRSSRSTSRRSARACRCGGPLGRVPELGGPLLPPRHRGRQGRDPDPDPHVLLGLRRHHGAHPGDGRRRAPDRGRPLPDGAAP